MEVFDDLERTDGRPAQHDESAFDFLNRAAGEYWDAVRTVIQEWVDGFCPDDLADIVGRLKSGDPVNFAGACWELFLHESLTRLGFRVTCHPEMEGTTRRPDFMAESDDCTVLVEATVVHESPDDQGSSARKAEIYGELNHRVSSNDVFLQVSFDEESTGNVPFKRLGRDVQRHLDELDLTKVKEDYEVGGILAVDPYVWDDGDGSGWRIRFRPIPKRTPGPSEQIVGLMAGEAGFIDDASPIRTSLEGKSSCYGKDLSHPYVVAIASHRRFSDTHDFIDALFGQEVLVYFPETDETASHRKPNGLWNRPGGLDGEHVSAVLTSSNFSVYKFVDTSFDLFEHPTADNPLNCDLPYATVHSFDGDGSMISTEASATLAELHELEPPWPPGRPF